MAIPDRSPNPRAMTGTVRSTIAATEPISRSVGHRTAIDREVMALASPSSGRLARSIGSFVASSRFSLDGLEVFGPGAKIQVTFDQPDRACEVLHFWREVEEEQTLDLISADDAAKVLRQVVAPEGAAHGARIAFDSPDFGYFALPPRELQPALIPAYRFQGAVHLDDETYRFLRFVPAVRPDPDAIKELGFLFHRAPRVF
jgi:hypothetical protein